MTALSRSIRGLQRLGQGVSRLTLGECMVGVAIAALYLAPYAWLIIAVILYFGFPLHMILCMCAGRPLGGRYGSLSRRLSIAIGGLVLFNWVFLLFPFFIGLPIPGSVRSKSIMPYLVVGLLLAPVVLSGFLVFIASIKYLRLRRWRQAMLALPPPEEDIRWI